MTGLEDVELGPVVWTRRHVSPWAGKTLDQSERIALVRVPAFKPQQLLRNNSSRRASMSSASAAWAN